MLRHHKRVSMRDVMRDIGKTVHGAEKEVMGITEAPIKSMEKLGEKLGGNMTLPLLVVGGVALYFFVKK